MSRLLHVRSNMVGAVLNRAGHRAMGYMPYYGRGYRYGYGYTYGYSYGGYGYKYGYSDASNKNT